MKENFEKKVYAACEGRYGKHYPPLIGKRLREELDFIAANGLEEKFLIAQEIAKAMHKDDSQFLWLSSVNNSLVAFLLGITYLDPLPPHRFCCMCGAIEFSGGARDGFDLPAQYCPECGKTPVKPLMYPVGHDLDPEWFMDEQEVENLFSEIRVEEKNFPVLRDVLARHYPLTPFAAPIKRGANIFFGWYLAEREQLAGLPRISVENWEEPCVMRNYERDLPCIVVTDLIPHSEEMGNITNETPARSNMKALKEIWDSFYSEPASKESLLRKIGIYPDGDEYNWKRAELRRGEFCKHIKERNFASLVDIRGLYVNLEPAPCGDYLHALCDRDSIMKYLLQQGLDRKEAFRWAKSIGGWKKDTDFEQLRKCGVSSGFIEAAQQLENHRFPRWWTLFYTQIAIRIAELRTWCPEIFERIVGEKGE